MKNKRFCIKPFTSAWISTEGQIRTCCRIRPNLSKFQTKDYNIKKNTLKDFWNSDYRKYLQNEFLEEKLPSECSHCWKDEQVGVKSERQFANDHYKILGNKKPDFYLNYFKKRNLVFPENLNVDISNLCNLKCIMCSGRESSRLLIENNHLGIENLNQKDFEIDQSKIDSLLEEIKEQTVKNIVLQGGEPLMNPNILRLIENLSDTPNTKDISIWITTNGTQYNEKILKILQKYRSVKLIFSIDGVGSTSDYIRFPSKWKDIEKNVSSFRKELTNATFQISFTVQNLNLLDIENIIKFSNNQKIHLKLNVLRYPEYLQLNVLPKEVLEISLEKILNLDKSDITHVTSLEGVKKMIVKSLEGEHDLENNLSVFKDIMNKRDEYRKIKMENFLPDLAKNLNIGK